MKTIIKHRAIFITVAVIVFAALIGLWVASHQSWIGEQPGSADYIHKVVGLLTDLPHMTAELFYSQVDNLLSWVVVAFIVRRYVDRKVAAEHERLDEEHGYDHKEHED